METFFPAGESLKSKSYYNNLAKRTRLVLQEIIEEVDKENEIEKLDNLILNLYKPTQFGGHNGLEAYQKKQFEDICTIMEGHGIVRPERLTVFQFHQKLEFIRNKVKKSGKTGK